MNAWYEQEGGSSTSGLREIVLDTETTGLRARGGDRLIEIGCIELIDSLPSGAFFHTYINPERDVPHAAFLVHGLSREFLSDKPLFTQIAGPFLEFVGSTRLVIHNASFDMGFLNMELERAGYPLLPKDQVLDSLDLARQKFPTGSNSLDALCRRFKIDNTHRKKHGALLDAELLAEVYAALTGARTPSLLSLLGQEGKGGKKFPQKREGFSLPSPLSGEQRIKIQGRNSAKPRPSPLPSRLTELEKETHLSFLKKLGGTVLWECYLPSLSENKNQDP